MVLGTSHIYTSTRSTYVPEEAHGVAHSPSSQPAGICCSARAYPAAHAAPRPAPHCSCLPCISWERSCVAGPLSSGACSQCVHRVHITASRRHGWVADAYLMPAVAQIVFSFSSFFSTPKGVAFASAAQALIQVSCCCEGAALYLHDDKTYHVLLYCNPVNITNTGLTPMKRVSRAWRRTII